MSDKNGKSSVFGQIVVAVVITLLVGSSAPWWWSRIFPDPTNTPTPIEAATQPRPPTLPPPEPDTEEPMPAGCVITIENRLVPLMSEPDPFSQQLVRVTPGRYPTLEYTTATFAGTDQGWFKIDVDGRIGWVRDDIIFIESKTSSCP